MASGKKPDPQGEDGCEYLNCVLIDITQTKQEQEQLRLTMERHQIIMDQTNDIIFEWDIAEDTISYSSNWFNKFGYLPIAEQIATKIPQAPHILPEDIQSFVKLMQDVVSGLPYGEAELRIANSDGRYIWCRIRATTQFDDSGRPVKAVGVILDIDSEKRRAQDLIEKADRDNLTHLYNKDAARRRIEHFLKQRETSETAAMMIIDLDNFKLVNDSHGHMFGDAVLVEVSRQLQKLFRSRDVVARIGGDEFMVFVTNLPIREILGGAGEGHHGIPKHFGGQFAGLHAVLQYGDRLLPGGRHELSGSVPAMRSGALSRKGSG